MKIKGRYAYGCHEVIEIDISAEELLQQLKGSGINFHTEKHWIDFDKDNVFVATNYKPKEPQYCECVGGSRVSSHGKCWECGKPIKPTCEQGIEELELRTPEQLEPEFRWGKIQDKINELIRWTKREGR